MYFYSVVVAGFCYSLTDGHLEPETSACEEYPTWLMLTGQDSWISSPCQQVRTYSPSLDKKLIASSNGLVFYSSNRYPAI